MSKFKKLVLVLIVAVISFVSFGCAQVSFSTVLKDGGAIIQSIDIDLTNLDTNNKNIVYKVIKEYNNQLDRAYKDNLVGKFNNIYDSEVYANLSNEQKFDFIVTRNPNYILSDLEISEINSNTKLFYRRTFVNIYSYLMYFYPDVLQADGEKGKLVVSEDYTSLIDIPFNSSFDEEDKLFVSTYIQTCYPFYYNGQEPKLIYDFQYTESVKFVKGQKLSVVLASLTGKTEEEIDLFFDFSTPYSRLHSNGNVVMTDNGYTHYFTLENINSSVIFYRNYANYTAWYVLAAGIGIAIVVVGFVVIKIVKSRKKKKGLEVLKKINDFENKWFVKIN